MANANKGQTGRRVPRIETLAASLIRINIDKDDSRYRRVHPELPDLPAAGCGARQRR
jgi:hypothetical protein